MMQKPKLILPENGILVPKREIIMPGVNHQLFTRGNPVIFQHFRKGRLIDEETVMNGITTAGKNSLLDIMFRAQTQLTAWYFGLIDNAGFTALADADVANSHTGWVEVTTYDEATRPQWSPDAAASAAISNTTAVTFNINATKTLNGMFIISQNTKGGTTGILWATASFSTTKPVADDDQIKLTYQIQA